MVDLFLCIPPISQVNYPYIAAPTLKAILAQNGFSATLGDANMAFFNYIRQKAESLLIGLDWYEMNNFYRKWDPMSIDEDFTISWLRENLPPEALAVGFSVASRTAYPWTLQAAVHVKKFYPQVKVVLGGPFFDDEIALRTIKNSSVVDAVAFGESDSSLLEYLAAQRRSDFDAANRVGGFAVRIHNGDIDLNSPTQSHARTVFSPPADFTDLPLDDYLDYRIGTRILPILGSRGCVGRCVFCAERRIWGNYRCRLPQEIVGEMKYQMERHATRAFRFNDSLLNADVEHLRSLCALLIRRGINVEWAGNARLHENLSMPLLIKMRRAGCRQLWFGLESASPRILSLMRKDISIDTAARVLKNTKDAGILVLLFLIADFPGEQLADTKATVDFLEKNASNIDAIHISDYKLIRNSPMYEEAWKFGISVDAMDEFGVSIIATHDDTTCNRMLLDQAERSLRARRQVPWPLVGSL